MLNICILTAERLKQSTGGLDRLKRESRPQRIYTQTQHYVTSVKEVRLGWVRLG
jgi:hypothetical protein